MANDESLFVKLRRERDLSQKALAARSGVAPGYLSRLEAGEFLLSEDVAVKIAPPLGVDVTEVMVLQRVDLARKAIRDGTMGPERARRLIAGLQGHQLSEFQREALKSVEDALAESLACDHAENMRILGRDSLGRRISQERTERDREIARKEEWTAEDSREFLGRDALGRRRRPRR